MEWSWRLFLVGRGRRHGGPDVFRTNGAALQRHEQQHENQRDDASADVTGYRQYTLHWRDPPAGLLLKCTGIAATREFDGSTITTSVGCRPETISTLLP